MGLQSASGRSEARHRCGALLFHDIHPQTVRVLQDVIDRLRSERFSFVKSAKLLEQKYGANA